MILKQFVQQFKGSSFPTLIETNEGKRWIVKMRGAGNGPISLVSEFIANKVASRLHWPAPNADWVEIPDQFPWTFGTDEFDDIVQKSYGWNLAIEYLPDAAPIQASDLALLDSRTLDIIFTLDLFFLNVDRTAMACNLLKASDNRIWVIDHGALGLFQGMNINHKALFLNHIFQGLPTITPGYLSELHQPELFSEAIRQIPLSILTDAGVSANQLFSIVEARMNVMTELVSNPSLYQNTKEPYKPR